MADAHEAFGQDMLQEAPDQLSAVECHRLKGFDPLYFALYSSTKNVVWHESNGDIRVRPYI